MRDDARIFGCPIGQVLGAGIGLALGLGLALALAACEPGEPGPQAEDGEALAGGETTVFDATPNAFSLSARNMSFERRQRFVVGNSFFNKNWVQAPSSTEGRDGLGPTFNARSCSTCHLKDGRGRPPGPDEEFVSMLLRLSIPGAGPHGEPLAVPGYGGQLGPHGIDGVPGEGTPTVVYVDEAGSFDDGEPYSLRRPTYAIEAPAYGPLPDDLMISPRVAPAMIGMGLLEAIPEAAIVAGEDPEDDDGDGISGRVNRVWDAGAGALALGRFGWKANQPSVRQQVAGAFLGDIGITSSLFTMEDCPAEQAECLAAMSGGSPEIDDGLLDDVVFYSSTLAVPARRGVDDPEVLRGKGIFADAGCEGCHTPRLETADDAAIEEARGQTIWPYTDLLLHDMGEGLADGRPDFGADGQEWRTPPLWGIGLVETVNGHTNFLHDGRARSLMEAILWHGGEGERSRDAVLALAAADRAALVAFLESL
ncbi:MAG: c-type cytochrome [Myxococcales bacterium]|nr:c-type cytochrome [Myxococcales bacterium]